MLPELPLEVLEDAEEEANGHDEEQDELESTRYISFLCIPLSFL
jgi:hypothetical protein